MGDLARILIATRSFSKFSEAKESVENNAGTEIKAIINNWVIPSRPRLLRVTCLYTLYCLARLSPKKRWRTSLERGRGSDCGGNDGNWTPPMVGEEVEVVRVQGT